MMLIQHVINKSNNSVSVSHCLLLILVLLLLFQRLWARNRQSWSIFSVFSLRFAIVLIWKKEDVLSATQLLITESLRARDIVRLNKHYFCKFCQMWSGRSLWMENGESHLLHWNKTAYAIKAPRSRSVLLAGCVVTITKLPLELKQ